jgi:hypothetical protein
VPTAGTVHRLLRLEALVEALSGETALPSASQLMLAAGMPPDDWQREVLESDASRRLLVCCRQSGKTTVAAAMALATALREPGALVLVLSPSLRQSQESFHRVTTLYRTMQQPIPTEASSALRLALVNGSRIISLPGTEATVRGYSGVKLLVIEEANRVVDDLYHAVTPMLAVSGGKVLALSTPYGRRGWFFEAWERGQGWERTRVTASECSRIPAAFLDQERLTMPRLWYQAEYECVFTDTDQTVFREEDLQAMLDPSVEPWAFLLGEAYASNGRV